MKHKHQSLPLGIKFIASGMALITVMHTSGCGGGGGSPKPEVSTPTPVTPTPTLAPTPAPTTPVTPTPTPAPTTAPQYSAAVTFTGADTFINAGYDGSGVKITILDSGAEPLTDIDSRVKSRQNMNFDVLADGRIVKNTETATFNPLSDHGTHMAAAAAGSTGIAPGAYILAGNVTLPGTAGYTSWINIYSGARYYANQSKIMNASFQYVGNQYYKNPTTMYEREWNTIVDSLKTYDILLNIAGGNDGSNMSTRITREDNYVKDVIKVPELASQMIVVGAVATDKRVETWSAIPGDDTTIQSRWLTTLGSSQTIENNGGVSWSSGTSNAAANVSGGAALIKQKWSHLGGKELANILLSTANKNFSGYSARTHGNGVMDLNKAFQPIGTVSSSLSSPTSIALNSLSLPAGVKVSSFTSSAFDRFGRDFPYQGNAAMIGRSTSLQVAIDQFSEPSYLSQLNQQGNHFILGGSYQPGLKRLLKPAHFLGESETGQGLLTFSGAQSGTLYRTYFYERPTDLKQTASVSMTHFNQAEYLQAKYTMNPQSFAAQGDFTTSATEMQLVLGQKVGPWFYEGSTKMMRFGGDSGMIRESQLMSHTLSVGGWTEMADMQLAAQYSRTIGQGSLNIHHAIGRDSNSELMVTEAISMQQNYQQLSLSLSNHNLFFGANLSDEPSLNQMLLGYRGQL